MDQSGRGRRATDNTCARLSRSHRPSRCLCRCSFAGDGSLLAEELRCTATRTAIVCRPTNCCRFRAAVVSSSCHGHRRAGAGYPANLVGTVIFAFLMMAVHGTAQRDPDLEQAPGSDRRVFDLDLFDRLAVRRLFSIEIVRLRSVGMASSARCREPAKIVRLANHRGGDVDLLTMRCAAQGGSCRPCSAVQDQ